MLRFLLLLLFSFWLSCCVYKLANRKEKPKKRGFLGLFESLVTNTYFAIWIVFLLCLVHVFKAILNREQDKPSGQKQEQNIIMDIITS